MHSYSRQQFAINNIIRHISTSMQRLNNKKYVEQGLKRIIRLCVKCCEL